MITEYVVVEEEYSSELEKRVVSYLKRGYTLQGGVTIVSYGFSMKYLQAVVK